MANESTTPKNSREEGFVRAIIEKCNTDKGLAARLRRADNPSSEYQSWDVLASFGVDLEKEHQRLPFVTIAAAIAKAKAEKNGSASLGKALISCYDDGRDSTPGKARLRRLLACDNLAEACRILRPIFTLIDSKSTQGVDYARLLKQLRRFAFEDSRQQVRAQWAQDFYSQPAKPGELEVTA